MVTSLYCPVLADRRRTQKRVDMVVSMYKVEKCGHTFLRLRCDGREELGRDAPVVGSGPTVVARIEVEEHVGRSSAHFSKRRGLGLGARHSKGLRGGVASGTEDRGPIAVVVALRNDSNNCSMLPPLSSVLVAEGAALVASGNDSCNGWCRPRSRWHPWLQLLSK